MWLRLVLVVLLASCAAGGGAAGRTLRVMVFNVHAGRDATGIDNLQRVAALITSTKADLVLLQEVDRHTRRSGGVDQLAVLTELTHLHGAFGKSLDYQGGEYGIAILTRWPIVGHASVALPVDPPQVRANGAVEPRVALVVDTRLPGGALRLINTHLDASREDHYRLQELEHLLGTVDRQSPVLVGGDFNAVPESNVYERVLRSGLRDAWCECGAGEESTYPADAPVKRIDYLFLSAMVLCQSAFVLESTASDHRPVLVTIRITPSYLNSRR